MTKIQITENAQGTSGFKKTIGESVSVIEELSL